ncbi:MAG TPA: SH3 domain-containing protein [Aurantimonas coralicida]|uniref:SH3 domain-containing protein n=2 Tax=root TaxID=1 RepID=A0A9C9NHB7_9HYPH|nr:SH3 domain-containing protein [Aurantimonas coralicida]HEU01258.1 SH3 domain-containing protein [Aurantimonas coralicida]
MAKRKGGFGWIVAGLVGIAWLSSGEEKRDPISKVSPGTEAHEPLPAERIKAPLPVRKPEKPVASSQERVAFLPPTSMPTTLPGGSHPQRGRNDIAFAASRLNLRASPSTSSAVMRTLDEGEAVTVLETAAPWRKVRVGSAVGWVHGAYLRQEQGRVINSRPPLIPPAPIIGRAVPSRAGQPIRSARQGSCDCPYDVMRNGRVCGGRSAYSRPGGRSPQCYF